MINKNRVAQLEKITEAKSDLMYKSFLRSLSDSELAHVKAHLLDPPSLHTHPNSLYELLLDWQIEQKLYRANVETYGRVLKPMINKLAGFEKEAGIQPSATASALDRIGFIIVCLTALADGREPNLTPAQKARILKMTETTSKNEAKLEKPGRS